MEIVATTAIVSAMHKTSGSSNRPGPHNKNPRHKTFAKGWVAQKHIFVRYLDECAKTFQYFPRVGSENTGIF